MDDPYFFGYGSLVNDRTHAYAPVYPAQVRGWRRAWRKSLERTRCYLTAVPDRDAEILGLIAPVPGADWAALDLREAAYERHAATHVVEHEAPGQPDVAIYAVPPADGLRPTEQDPVILSYIDVVVQGFLAVYGPSGVDHFFDTTSDWQVCIIDDRSAPIYARAQSLTDHERTYVDQGLARVGARITAL